MTLPANLQYIIADLNAKIEDKEYTAHARDVFKAIKYCIEARQPIGSELQSQYVQIIANDQRQNRYGK